VSRGALSRGVKTFANYNYLISRVPSFLIESRATPGICASIYIKQKLKYLHNCLYCFIKRIHNSHTWYFNSNRLNVIL
jgi:hypothetical protein